MTQPTPDQPAPLSGPFTVVPAPKDPQSLRDRYAAALTRELTHYARSDIDPGTGSDVGDQVAIVMAVRDEELVRLRAKAADADRIISWHTTCASCARTLDSAYAETRRADTAEADLNTCRDRYAVSADNAMTELAAKDAELVAARSTIDRVQSLADWLASHSELGIHLEADGIRRGIADRLHDALGEQPPNIGSHTYEGDGGPCTTSIYGTICRGARVAHQLIDEDDEVTL